MRSFLIYGCGIPGGILLKYVCLNLSKQSEIVMHQLQNNIKHTNNNTKSR